MKNFNSLQKKNRFTSVGTLALHCAATLTVILSVVTSAWAQPSTPPKTYTCYLADRKISIDGRLNEQAWKKAPWTSSFVDIEGDKKPLPLQETRAKMLWDDEYLYIGAQIEEEHIWAYQDKKDQIVYLENDFEVFIDPDGDTENYYELEINAINNTFDLFLPKTYRKGGRAQIKWDIAGLKSAVSVEGTVNDASDKDKRWFVEIAIPFKALSTDDVPPLIPQHGSEWRINFSRVNWQHEVSDAGRYSRKRNAETGKIVPEYNWVWSPQGVINMHFPEFWGRLYFSREKPGKTPVADVHYP